jgi:hypothetical protein
MIILKDYRSIVTPEYQPLASQMAPCKFEMVTYIEAMKVSILDLCGCIRNLYETHLGIS